MALVWRVTSPKLYKNIISLSPMYPKSIGFTRVNIARIQICEYLAEAGAILVAPV